ncbi:hypothetical protein L2E82_21320 [Cichorium intybus]|uniref:Uncharacterized protein n=1 Tax=Cichorium intybus TaxID=13427 RepID=A0ACB9DW32_CICIN|nr:hypothetical protein L2E82_21320 [Cichorium intybus]
MAISTSTATQAVDALIKWKNTQSDSHNPQLLPQDDFIYLILTLKKIPQKGGINGVRTNPNKIPLPHPLISATSFSELCLIIDDRPKSNLTSQIAKKKIKEDGISVTKVIKLSKLKTDYKPFEAKRKLCDSYEMFFADKRVIPLLPKLLGKQFFKKKKLPLPVDLSHKNWKEQIERACSAALLFFSTGTCCVVRVAKASMERDEIVENVSAAIDGILEFVPKKLSGVRSLHLKFSESVALPLYQSLPDIKLRIEGIKEQKVEQEVMGIEEVGKKKKSKKGRIHEVNNDMDEDENEGGEIENNDSEVKPTKKIIKEKKGAKDSDKKKRKENAVEVNNVNKAPSNKKAKKKVEGVEEEVVKNAKVEKTKLPKKGKIHEVNHDKDEGGEIENNEVKSAKSVKEKKRKGNDVNTTPSDKKAKKKGEKQNEESVKKEKKKGRSVSRV